MLASPARAVPEPESSRSVEMPPDGVIDQLIRERARASVMALGSALAVCRAKLTLNIQSRNAQFRQELAK